MKDKLVIVNDNGEATIYIYEQIGGFLGVPVEDLVKEIAALKVSTIHLRINSPGGDVFDARAIEAVIREHPANVIAHIDGVAASSASFLALAANQVEMGEGAFFMIHNAMAIARGNATALMEVAALLEKVDGSINGSYQRKTGLSEDQIREWMNAETWFTAKEALEHGFIDSIYENQKPDNVFNWDEFEYRNIPEALFESVETKEEPTIENEEVAEDEQEPVVEQQFDHAANERLLELLKIM